MKSGETYHVPERERPSLVIRMRRIQSVLIIVGAVLLAAIGGGAGYGLF
jgi:hypothetical protein